MSSSEEASTAEIEQPKPPIKEVTLRWSGEGLRFEGGPADRPPSIVDAGPSKAGPSPMDHLLLGVAGCMGADVLSILGKSRVPVQSMRIEVEGHRADTAPKRFTRIVMSFHLHGPTSADRPKVERAVNLSRDTYCSAMATLRPDLDILLEVHLD